MKNFGTSAEASGLLEPRQGSVFPRCPHAPSVYGVADGQDDGAHQREDFYLWQDRLDRMSEQSLSYASEKVVGRRRVGDNLKVRWHDLGRKQHVPKQACGDGDERRDWVALLG